MHILYNKLLLTSESNYSCFALRFSKFSMSLGSATSMVCVRPQFSGSRTHLQANSCGTTRRARLTVQKASPFSPVTGLRRDGAVRPWREEKIWTNWPWKEIWFENLMDPIHRETPFHDALNTFYLWLYRVRHMVKNHSR